MQPPRAARARPGARRAPATLVAALLVCLVAAGCTGGSGSGDPVTGGRSESDGASGGGATGGLTSDRLVVETDAGPVRGILEEGDVLTWRGIPYAAPPVGDRRWRPPAPVEAWAETRDATAFGDSCLQGTGSRIAADTSEDCLFLNVFSPAAPREGEDEGGAGGLPVMVWIHGGGFTSGSGDLMPDVAAGLVEQGVVVVSLNYRLGRLGYLAHPALAAEQDGEPVANFGLTDQVAALEWVQRNVASFGGDPDTVTVFGISAGGMSVNDLMSAPQARGLFDRAISGSGLGREDPPSYRVAAGQGEALLGSLRPRGDDAAALRALPAAEVARLDTFVLRNEVPILDAVLPRSPADTFAAGEEAPVPYLVGSTDLEFVPAVFQALGIDPVPTSQRLLTGRGRAALNAYGDGQEVERHFLNDVVFTEPARLLAAEHAERAPTYRYRFAIASPATRRTYGGVVHGQDFVWVFGRGDDAVPGAADLAEGVATCWATFAREGVPDCGPDWPTAETGRFVEFTTRGPEVVRRDPWQDRLDLVGSLYE